MQPAILLLMRSVSLRMVHTPLPRRVNDVGVVVWLAAVTAIEELGMPTMSF